MTKQIRIENADTSDYKVKVEVQDRVWDPVSQVHTDEWVTVKTVDLDFPTFMATEYLTSTRRLVVSEKPKDPA